MTKVQQQQYNSQSNSNAVLPWLRVPVRVAAGSGVALPAVRGLPPPLRAALEAPPRAFRELLPVQAAAWAQLGGGLSDAHDLCLAAPTGSGKTLAYALPLVNGLLLLQRSAAAAGAGAGVAGGAAAAGDKQPHHEHDNDNANHRGRPLRALVVVPTRDLAAQVHALVADLCASVGLRVALAAAQRPAAEEAAACVGARAQAAAPLLPPMAGDGSDGNDHGSDSGNDLALRGGGGRADVLVATPGRLVALLPGGAGRWPGLCLARLRFLVVDEADRLLRQAYQDWLPRVLEAAAAASAAASDRTAQGAAAAAASADHPLLPLLPCSAAPPFGPGARLVKMIVSATLTRDPSKLARFDLWQPRYVALVAAGEDLEEEEEQRGGGDVAAPAAAAAAAGPAAVAPAEEDGGAADAAATSDEEEDDGEDEDKDDGDDDDDEEEAAEPPLSSAQRKRAPAPAAAAADPLQARFQLPPTLEQHRLVAQAHRKPLALASLLRELGPGQRTLVFCSSVDTTRRLYLLLSALLGLGALPCGVAELGGHMSAARRAEAVGALRSGRAGVLVSSDAMARGMDVVGTGGGGGGGDGGGGGGGDGGGGGVRTVVCYDFPPSARAYVHRAGRTARAGAGGAVVSLLRPQEVVHFRRMLKGKVGGGAGGGRVREWRLAREHREAVAPALRGAMLQVRELLESEGVMGAATGAGVGGSGGGGGLVAAAAAAAGAEEEEDSDEAAAEGGSDAEEAPAAAAAAAADDAQPRTRAQKKLRTS